MVATHFKRGMTLPAVVLGISLALTAVATWALGRTITDRDRARMQNAVTATRDQVQARLDAYVALLVGTHAFFAASEDVNAAEFATFVGRLHLTETFPGIQGIGYAAVVPAGGPEVVERRMRAVYPDFTVWGEPGQPLRTSILYLAPLDERNRAALGYDMTTEPTRARAMDRAAADNEPALTGRVILKQEIDEDVQAGFLIYVPIYEGAVEPADAASRQAALRGYAYAPFRAEDLFSGIAWDPRVSFAVYDGEDPAPETLLFDSGRLAEQRTPMFVDTVPLSFYGHRWTLTFETLPAFEAASEAEFVPLVGVVGTILSLLLFAATRAQERARHRAVASEAARSRFFAAMSHELRTPINAIVGYNDLLLAGVYGALQPKQETGIERSQRAALHMAELVNDVLDLSKLAAGKLRLELEDVAIPEVLQELLSTIRPIAEDRGCELRLETDRCRGTVRTDPRRVRQIVLNLVSNATKFGAGSAVVLRCAEKDGGVRIEVGDRGPGIPPDQRERIFEEFVQLEGMAVGGTGLGLTISRQLAEQLGGTLEVDSAEGRGSTFRLWLPRTPPPADGDVAV